MTHEGQARKDLVSYCQTTAYSDNSIELQLIEEFQRSYAAKKAIYWYTRECFIYQMLNRALRLLEADIIVIMGFFIHDLHHQISRMHKEQIHQYNGKPFIVYRGQELSVNDFETMKKSQGGLMSFNNFLSTSKMRDLCLTFAQNALRKRW